MLKDIPGIRLDARHHGYPYQVAAVEAVKALPYAAIFHEQGLGKTKIGIDLALEWLREKSVDSVLIVTKRGLIDNWVDELKTHSHLSPRVLSQDRRSNYFALNSPARIFLIHYEAVKSEEARLRLFTRARRIGIILDEAHKIKNPDSGIAKCLHRLGVDCVRRVIMTGTPVANRPYDLWSQIYFLDNGEALGTEFDAFKEELDLSNQLWTDVERQERFSKALSAIFDKIQRFTVRETKSSAGIDLPEKHVENVLVDLAPIQRSLYERYRRELGSSVLRGGQFVHDDAEDILKRLLRLVQLASNPVLVDQAYTETPGKVVILRQLLAEALSGSWKAIVWTNFVENARWLTELLSELGAVAVHGALGYDERQRSIRLFKNDESCRVLVATPGAAKEGLTLTVANCAIFYDRSFSLDDYLQAQDRIHRISQTRTCFVWNLVGRDTVDEWVDALLAAKRLAAQLAQADIDEHEYNKRANYEFGKIVYEILGITKEGV